MIIDFHTHAFPEKIAERTVAALGKAANMTPLTNGTVDGLCRKLAESGVDLGVILPVVTRADQFDSINRFAASVNSESSANPKRVISFGGIHPDDEDPEGHVRQIKEMGLRGIKLHPDYQGVYIDDERYVRIARAALAEGLVIVTHAGVDVGFPGHPVRCTPERAARFIDAVSDGKEELPIVFAHGGGYAMHEDVMKHLCSRKVYIDISMMPVISNAEETTALIRAHGAERILFASDCPWGDPGEGIVFVRSLPITEEERELILHKNAERLLGL